MHLLLFIKLADNLAVIDIPRQSDCLLCGEAKGTMVLNQVDELGLAAIVAVVAEDPNRPDDALTLIIFNAINGYAHLLCIFANSAPFHCHRFPVLLVLSLYIKRGYTRVWRGCVKTRYISTEATRSVAVRVKVLTSVLPSAVD